MMTDPVKAYDNEAPNKDNETRYLVRQFLHKRGVGLGCSNLRDNETEGK